MKMASRNIANMHLFLEMKKKFPDLPEDTLRNYVLLYAEDQNKCVSQLQKESKNHFHSSKKFSEFHLSESKTRHKKNPNMKIDLDQAQIFPNCNAVFLQNNTDNQVLQNNSEKMQPVLENQSNSSRISARSTINLPLKPSNLNIPIRNDAKSAPVLGSNNKPFITNYKDVSMSSSSQAMVSQTPSDRMMFSTTKQHTIMPLETTKGDKDSLENPRHAVKLSITPSFPYPQQQLSVYTSAVSASTSQSSKPGRHTTSLNLQLQPHSEDPYPVEISTIPTNIGNPSDFRDFGSHLQISVGAQGATFTALRLQRPQMSQNQYTNQLPSQERASFNVSPSSSQPQDSKVYKFSTTLRQVSDSPRKENVGLSNEKYENNFSKLISDNEFEPGYTQISSLHPRIGLPSENVITQSNFGNGWQATPGYVQAVKKHQLARLDLVREELSKEKATCSKLKTKVNDLEQDLMRRQEKKSSFSYAELLQKLKEENRKLRIECNCLLMEYDISSKGKIPVGMTDEDFYSNIFTGPNDGLALYSNGIRSSKEIVSPATRKVSSEEEEEDERNRWKCKKCTFANHPALEKCEMCELPKNSGSFFDEG